MQILKTLKHIPVPNRNELEDSKLETIVQKWCAATTLTTTTPGDKPTRSNSTDDNSNEASGKMVFVIKRK